MRRTAKGGPSELEMVRAALEDDYDILEEIGRGGMAIVYRARERELDRHVAVKVLPPQFAFDESFVDRFQREGRIAAQLEHPHIVPIYRVGRSGQVIYIVMKLLRGESLSGRLGSRGALPAEEVRRILAETASALGYAAKRGVVHRDVKPHNIMLDEEGRCLVTDFGIARSAADSKLTATGMSVGTPRYMSPEQARAKPLDGRSDLYSLGIVGYECLVGTTPFDGEDAFAILMEHIKAPVPRPALRTEEEHELFAVIERMLAKDPADRFHSGEEVIAALEEPALGARASGARTRRWGGVSPTQPLHGAEDPGDPAFREPSGPEPSLALDRALHAGVALIKQQAAKLGVGPHASAAAAGVAQAVRLARGYAAARGRRFWGGAAAATLLFVSSYYGAHFATKHRARCPVVDDEPAIVQQRDEDDAPTPAAARSRKRVFSLLVDAVGTKKVGAGLDVYYDVCGLEKGTAYTTTVTLTKSESGLRRILGRSVEPINVTYDETARGPATRRHRTLDLGRMPAGSYWLELVVRDAKGRRRSAGVGLLVSEP
jgi:tRNA A-37 threonylcarbamoyl transferase component Bud32